MGQTQAAFGVAIYMAFCRLSSRDKNSPVITCTVNVIAGMARLGYRKTFEVIHELATIGVIAITAGDRKPGDYASPPSTYTLTRLHNGKSGRLHNRKSPDCTRRTSSHADNPKDSPLRGESLKNKQPPVADGSASGERSTATSVVMKGLPE